MHVSTAPEAKISLNNICIATIAFCTALGFLNPISLGPSTAVWPNLLGLFAVGVLLSVAATSRCLVALKHSSHAMLWLALLSIYTLIHSAFILGFNPISTPYILTAVLMFGLGAALQMLDPKVIAPGLAYGVLFAALINIILGWIQFWGLEKGLWPFVNQLNSPGVIYGNVRQPNQYASLMAMGLASIWWFAKLRPRDQPSNSAKQTLLISSLLVTVLISGTVLSGSRTGLLELVFLAVAAWFWRGQKSTAQRKLTWLFLALPVIYLLEWATIRMVAEWFELGFYSGLERFADTAGPSRRTLWHNIIHLISLKPLLGYGIHELGYAHFVQDFSNLSWWPYKGRHMELLDNAHNILLQSWLEIGFIGMLLSVGVFVVAAIKARPWREMNENKQMAWMLIGALTLHSLLEYPLNYAQFWIPFCLALAIVFSKADATYSQPTEIQSNVTKQPYGSQIFIAFLGSLCLVLFAYAAWDYDRVSQAYKGIHRREIPLGVDRIAEAQKSWLFAPYARFAKLTAAELTPENAKAQLPELRALMHFSAEPAVLQRLLVALQYTNDESGKRNAYEMAQVIKRFEAAFPDNFNALKVKPK